MLDLKLLSGELDARREEIVGFEAETASVGRLYADRLRLIDGLDRPFNAQLGRYSGGRVLEEGELLRKFARAFASRQEATDWALQVLKGRNVAAVDGSQVYPSRHISVPIGLVQACAVVNGHGERRFTTATRLCLMLPADFERDGSYAYAQAPVSARRFELECQQIGELMRKQPGDMVFFDGSLVLSFIRPQDEGEQARYVDAVVGLLDVAEETRSPLIAYTDMSMSKDLVTLMRHAFRLPPSGHLTDAFLISDRLRWGDRTRAFLSDRDDRPPGGGGSTLDLYGRHRDGVAFFYIMAGGHLASKVEVPQWCCADGLIDDIADTIRAECIVRPGYPDIIHRAHEYSAISFAEAEMFRGMIDAFAAKHRIKIYKSAKEQNKQLGGKG